MTEDEFVHIAERHFDGLPPRPGEEAAYAVLDRVVAALRTIATTRRPG